ncbi:MAG: alpha/beta hydrolase [Clostridia bacterium]|nr:alpha/beta hydrolase [Clostridia bacterium]
MLIPTKVETYQLLEDRPMAKLIAYTAGTSDQMPMNEKRKAILIIPGGAYWLQSDLEADPVAHFFLSEGYNAFVLRYSVGRGVDSVWPKPLMEASAAMKFIRDHAEEFHIDPDYVFVIGFSAGGHLAAALGTMWDHDEIEKALDMKKGYNRPTAMVLSYPVITGVGDVAHRGSINNILGKMRDDEQARASVSIERAVSEKTVPAFLWTMTTDREVSPQNTLLMASALGANGIPYELHVYPEGHHGLSLGTKALGFDFPILAGWSRDAVRFLNNIQA